jgi:hypothetical protein
MFSKPGFRLFQMVSLLLAILLGLVPLAAGQTTQANSMLSVDKEKGTPATSDDKSDKPKPAKTPLTPDEVERLLLEQSKAVEALKEQVRQQQAEIEALKSHIGSGNSTVDLSPKVSSPISGTSVPTTNPSVVNPPQGVQEGPLSIKIGVAHITPVGFLDLTAVFRSTNTGDNIGTNFNSIPFGNVPEGNLTELRLSAQNSRIGFRVDALVHDAHVIGYMESDFLGNNPSNTFVSTNSNTLRSRLYWVDVRKGKFEFLGGQSWSLITPGRDGISPLPGDLFITQDIDVNYQVGAVLARQAQFRMVYHPNSSVALGLSLENPEQFVGNPLSVTFPKGLSSTVSSQFDAGNSLTVPNLHPDVIGKVAIDKTLGEHAFHFEGVGFFRGFRDTFLSAGNFVHSTKEGGGGAVNLNLEVIKNFRLISNNFFSAGGGRYVFGQEPDLIVRPDGSISLVKTFSTVQGIEATVKPNTLVYGYYGGVVSKKNFVVDTTDPQLANIGYGFPGSPSSQNRAIQEITAGITQTFWRDPRYGALQFLGQYSYVVRSPWFVAPGQPINAHTNMVFLTLRYSLPGSPPKKLD